MTVSQKQRPGADGPIVVQSLHDCASGASANFISRRGKEWKKVMNMDDVRFKLFKGEGHCRHPNGIFRRPPGGEYLV